MLSTFLFYAVDTVDMINTADMVYSVDTVDMVYTVDTFYTVRTIQTALRCSRRNARSSLSKMTPLQALIKVQNLQYKFLDWKFVKIFSQILYNFKGFYEQKLSWR